MIKPSTPVPRTVPGKAALRVVAIMMAVLTITATSLPRAQARESGFIRGAPMRLAQQDDIGASAAASAASAASGGRVLNVQRLNSQSGVIYRVKVLLPGGLVRRITVDGRTGQVR